MAEATGIDFNKIPLVALRSKSRTILSQLLNCRKIIPSPSGYPRDYRGLADIACVPSPCGCPDPTATVLKEWEKTKPTFNDLRSALKEIDRFDALDDSANTLEEDAKEYLKRAENGPVLTVNNNLENDVNILTIDDIALLEKGLEPQNYHAFLLYSDEDSEFAMRIVDKLENEYNLKLCLKDRDLIGGVSFEHEAIMRLISERCNRLIVVVSQHFLNSAANKFFLAYAQALGIEQRKRKIVPCLYERVENLPPELSYYFILDYNRANQLWNFWDKLSQSVTMQATNFSQKQNGKVQIKEIEWKESTKTVPSLENPKDWECPEKKKQYEKTNENLHLEVSSVSKTKKEKEKCPKSPTLSLLKKLLPNPPSGKVETRRFFQKKKKAPPMSTSS